MLCFDPAYVDALKTLAEVGIRQPSPRAPTGASPPDAELRPGAAPDGGVWCGMGQKHDLLLQIPTPKRKTCGLQGKWWYWLQLFRRRDGSEYVVGRFGWYRHGGSHQKVDVDWAPLTDAEQERLRAERAAAAELARPKAARRRWL